jgi:hypothetical protein
MRDTVIRARLVAHAFPLALAVLVFMAGCPSARAGQGYEFLQNRPFPKTPAEQTSECAWIRSEEARVRLQADEGASTAEKYNPAMAQSMKTEASQIQTQLEMRYAQIQCNLVPVAATQPVAPVPAQAPSQPSVPAPAQAPPSPALVAAPAPAAIQPVIAAPAQASAEPAAAPPCPGGLTFDQCFAKCRELTKRTAERCFDACRH